MISTKAQEAVKDDARAWRIDSTACFSRMFSFNWCDFLGRTHNFMLAGWLGAYNPVKSLGHMNWSPTGQKQIAPMKSLNHVRGSRRCTHSTMLCSSVFLASVAICADPRAQRRQLAPWKRASVGRWSRQVPPTRNDDDDPRRSSTSVGVDECGSRWHSTSNLPLEWTKEGRVHACMCLQEVWESKRKTFIHVIIKNVQHSFSSIIK